MSEFWIYFKLGLNHVLNWNAYDHVLFLIVLVASYTFLEWKRVFWLVTTFTLGHTVALLLATFDVVKVNSAYVEFLIPVTIFITALYNLINKKIDGINISLNDEKAFKKADVIIDFTIPKCTFEVLKIAAKLRKRVVIGTTGFTKKEENLIKKYSRKIPILKAGNMSMGINLLMYLTEIASASLGNNYLSKVFEVHHRHKKDHPSGTALMLGRGIAVGKNKDFYKLIGKKFLNKKSFPYGKKINFNSIRKGEVIGEHEVRFSSGKEIITLNHEAFDRALYSEGALTAAKWLNNKKPGLYSMRNLLNFK